MHSPFGFSNLDPDDEKGAIFKYRRQFKPDDEDSDHSVIHGLLLRLSNREKEHLPLMEEAEATTEPRHRDHHRYCHRRSASYYEKTPTFIVQVRGGLIDSEVSTSRWDVENEETQGTVRRPLRLQRLNADTGRGLFLRGMEAGTGPLECLLHMTKCNMR